MTFRIGLDIGGTKIEAVLLDAGGAVVAQSRRATGFGPQNVVEAVLATVDEIERGSGMSAAGLPVGIGIPGAVDPSTGRVRHAVNLGLEDFEFGAEIERRLGRSVHVENDVNVAALGAFHLLGSSGSLAYLNLGTGLAAGLVLDGVLRRGTHGLAGEIGHVPTLFTGPLCRCGQRGCLELFASGSALARRWPSVDPSPVRALLVAVADRNDDAIVVWRDFLEGVAVAVRLLTLTVDVDRMVIGGGLSLLGPILIDGVREVLEGWSRDSPLLASADLPARIALLPQDIPAAAVGAAWAADND